MNKDNYHYKLLNIYRLKRRMSIADFAEEIGLSYGVVRNALRGITIPHDFNRVVLDNYYREREKEILAKIAE